jgi:peptide chain release factor 2
MKQLSALRNNIAVWRRLEQRISDALELAELEDEDLRDELTPEVDALDAQLEQRELAAMLSGPYDESDALLTINAGAGGTDSQDWAAMLQRMYLRWAERRGYKAEILDFTEGEVAGIKTITISIEGELAFGYLRPEKGVHRLVRLSPFDSNNRRHTSFAQVEVLPQTDNDQEIEINPNDIRIDTFRASGAGGQSVHPQWGRGKLPKRTLPNTKSTQRHACAAGTPAGSQAGRTRKGIGRTAR